MFHPKHQLTYGDFELLGSQAFQESEDRLQEFRVPAFALYKGEQHLRLMEGIRGYEAQNGVESVDLWVVSAGYGLISSRQEIVPYDCTFRGMGVTQIHTWACHLGIPESARQLLERRFDLMVILLGREYLQALALDNDVELFSPTLFLASRTSKKHIAGIGKRRTVCVSSVDSQRFACGMIGLKGEIGKQLLRFLVEFGNDGLSRVFDQNTDVLDLLASDPEQ